MALSSDSEFYTNLSSFWPFISGASNTSSVYEYIIHDVVDKVSSDYQKWVYSIIGCMMVGLSGIFPLLIFPNGINENSKSFSYLDLKSEGGAESRQLKRLLCFAVGSLLGDVFLHLLPEAWQSARASGSSEAETLKFLGLWVLAGIICFVVCEMLVSFELSEDTDDTAQTPNPNVDTSNNNVANSKICNGNAKHGGESQKHIAGYLNLVANGFDNFTHGLAVAGSFIISPRIGLLTTAAILLHEIPHEIGDFAILLRSGFNPWSAAKAQLSTASIGLLGAIFTLSVDCMQTMGDLTWWILPFTAGGFINIALTNLLPDLVKESDPTESLKQLASLLLGIGVMTVVTLLYEV